MKIIAIIPARGGSKGVKRKNIRDLGGKPLIQYSIDVAKQSKYINKIVVSTDDEEIASISKELGASVIERPEELSGDRSIVMDAVRHVINVEKRHGNNFDLLILLEPTAPFRTIEDIEKTVILLQENKADSVATFSKTQIPPTRLWKIEDKIPKPYIAGSDPFLPRQEQDIGYALNGLVYALRISMLEKFPETSSFLIGKKIAHITPLERAIDIDTEFDFQLAEFLINQRAKN